MSPKDVHALIPRTCDCYLTQQEKDFVDRIKSRILRQEIILDYLGRPNIITRVSVRERQDGQS